MTTAIIAFVAAGAGVLLGFYAGHWLFCDTCEVGRNVHGSRK